MELKEAIYWLMMNGYEMKFSGSRHVAHTGFDTYINCVVSKKGKAESIGWEYVSGTIETYEFSGLEWDKQDSIKDVEKKLSTLIEKINGSS